MSAHAWDPQQLTQHLQLQVATLRSEVKALKLSTEATLAPVPTLAPPPFAAVAAADPAHVLIHSEVDAAKIVFPQHNVLGGIRVVITATEAVVNLIALDNGADPAISFNAPKINADVGVR